MFESTRLKLTLWYLLIIMLVSGFFSLIVYRGFTKELGRGFKFQSMQGLHEQRVLIQNQNGFTRILPFIIYPDEIPPQEYIEIIALAKHRFALQLAIINGGILLLAGYAGYFLAGKTLKPIEIMVTEQKRFVADASHELRTPLTSMKSEIEVGLRSKKLNLSEAKKLLKSNLTEVNKMKYFSDNLLSLIRYESNGQNISIEKVDLKEAVSQAIEKNRMQAKIKKIEIATDLHETTVSGNPQSLVELFSILINNSIKYSPEKSKIRIIATNYSRYVIVSVSDEGIGIDEKNIPYIFDRFFREDNSRTKQVADGYGLGLSIAKSIVELHGGQISVESKTGKGTTFKVKLLK